MSSQSATPARPSLKVKPAAGTLPVLQYCSPEQLKIDPDYQRSLDTGSSQGLIRRIAISWDWGLCQPLVVARRADGGLYVVDGQHRLAAAKLRDDIWQLPCVVASYRNAAEEAGTFVALNQSRRPLTPLDIFKAAVVAGDESAIAIVETLRRCGLSLAKSTNPDSWKPGELVNIGGIVKAWKAHGADCVGETLQLLAEAFQGQVLRYIGTIFPGAVWLYGELRVRSQPFSDWPDLLREVIAATSQREWLEAIHRDRASNPDTGMVKAAYNVLSKAWQEAAAEMLDEAA